jgi:cold shock CspA family protein
MAKSKQTSQKSEKEKKKRQKQKEKEEKRALRKANSNKGKSLEDMMAYVDHNGQLTDTPPDPKLKVEINAEDIQLGARSFSKEESYAPKTGRVAIYNNERKFGFIKDSQSQEKVFFHISDTEGDISEGDIVSYETIHSTFLQLSSGNSVFCQA